MQAQTSPHAGAPGAAPMSGTLVALFSLCAGVLVANLYYAQPIIELIAPAVGLSAQSASVIVSLTQIGYAIGLFIRVLEAEPEEVGEALSLTLTYAAALPAGQVDIRTRRLRQGGSIGVWEVELLAAGSDQVGVHGMVTLARRPDTPAFAFAVMPDAPSPESLPAPENTHAPMHYGAQAFERRGQDIFPP